MIALLLVAAYVAAGLAVARGAYLRIANDDHPDPEMDGMFACFLGAFWPATLLGAGTVFVVARETPGQKRKRVQRELAELEREVNRLRKEHDLP